MVTVKVKWTKQVYDVELDPTMTVDSFKEQLYKLTGVPTSRQKLMAKGLWKGMLKDDVDFASIDVKQGAQIMLMGSAETIKVPDAKPVFVEDMSVEEVAQSGTTLPAGLVNLGNTCYLNATLECLRNVPELRQSLAGHKDRNMNDLANAMVVSLRDTFDQLDKSVDGIPPFLFIESLRKAFPQFAQTEPRGGGYMQQDSDEFLQSLFNTISQKVKVPQSLPELTESENAVDALFGLDFIEKYECTETDAEPVVQRKEKAFKLVCNISKETNHLAEGIKLNLNGQIEKRAESLQRDAVWNKSVRINKLPRYLCVQFLRFYWKPTPDSADHAGVKCKMLRPIAFPMVLDVYEFCSEELQNVLRIPREKHAEKLLNEFKDEKKAEEAAKAKAAGEEQTPGANNAAEVSQGAGAGGAENEDDDESMADIDDEDRAALEAAKALSVGGRLAGPGLPADFKGNYELFSIVTHKGRSADSGHYIGWCRDKEDDWYCFDDDEVSPCKTEDIMKLKGGGDWHMTYLAFYRYKD